MRIIGLLIIFNAMFLYSCLESKSLSSQFDKEFKLTNMYEDSDITIGFNKSGGVFGFSGVNRYMGKYETDGDKITISRVATTRMMGKAENMSIESSYIDILSRVKTIEIEKDSIIIKTENEVLIFSI